MEFRRGSAMNNVNGKMLAALKFPLPNLTVQIVIANFLKGFADYLNGSLKQLPELLGDFSEQCRTVAKIEALAGKLEEACRLRQNSCSQAAGILRSTTSHFMIRAMDEYGGESLGNLIKMTSGSGLTSSQMDDSFKYPVYGGGGLTGRYSRYMFEEPKIVIGRVGARCGCVFVTEPKSWVTDNALYLTEISDNLDQSYLTWALANLDLRQQANQAAQPVVSQKRINPQKIPVPPIEEQQRIVAYLDSLQANVDALKKLQSQTAAELDALLPAILDRAFKGGL
jgi:type I restriction enzyme S subunit